jgi:hypothetical protein
VDHFRHARVSSGPKGPRVFWSSTTSDFQKERLHVHEWALPQLNAFCAARGRILTVVDLRSGFEDSDPAVGEILPICLEELEECQYYTCFIGQQMGCYAQDFSEAAGGGGASSSADAKAGGGKPKAKVARVLHERACTEIEARHVLERRFQWGTRAFFYVRDSRHTLSKVCSTHYHVCNIHAAHTLKRLFLSAGLAAHALKTTALFCLGIVSLIRNSLFAQYVTGVRV